MSAPTFDDGFGYALTQALSAYEMERLTGLVYGSDDFRSSIRSLIPTGFKFIAFPFMLNIASPSAVCTTIRESLDGRDIVQTRSIDAMFAVRCKIYLYAEDVMAVWVMLAVKHSNL